MKERLIGAAVLVGLGVWLIPWVLDGPQRPNEIEPASLELPAPHEPVPLRTQTIQLNERNDPLGAPPADADAPRRPASEQQSARTREPAQTADTARIQTAAAREDGVDGHGNGAAASRPAEEPRAAQTQPAQTQATQTQAAQTQAAPAPARPADEPARTEVAPTAAAGRWMVQLGSFGEEQNARRLAERVSGYGYRPEISNVRSGGRTLHRVRVGPYESRPRAEATASSLSAHGFVAQVVTTD